MSEDRGTPFRDGLEDCSDTTTAQHIIYNTKKGCLQPAVLRKLLSNTHPGAALPLSRPPKKKRSTTSPKTSPSSLSSPVRCRDRSHRQSPSANPVQRTSAKGSTPRTSKRPRVDAIKNALFESSCHCAGTGRARSDNLPRRNATATRARAMGQDLRLLAPVRGLTRPPIPHPFHGLWQNCPETFLHEDIDFFLFPLMRICVINHAPAKWWWDLGHSSAHC